MGARCWHRYRPTLIPRCPLGRLEFSRVHFLALPGEVAPMPIRFPDQFLALLEVDGLSDPAHRLHMAAIFWCNINRTDGLIRRENLALVTARVRAPERFAAECVRWGAWHDARHDCGSEHCPGPFDADGWVVHDYLRFAPSRAEMDAQESGMSGGGKRGNHRRWHEQRGITSPGCEFCEAPVAPEARVEPAAPKRTSGRRSGGDRVPDSGATPRSRSDQGLDLYPREENQDQNQDPDRGPDWERNRAPRVVALAVRILCRKSGRPVSNDDAIRAIGVLEKRAAEAGTVIEDPAKYFPAAVRKEPDVYAELLPPRAVPAGTGTPPAAVDRRWNPHAFEPHPNPAIRACGQCEQRRDNITFHPSHLQARPA